MKRSEFALLILLMVLVPMISTKAGWAQDPGTIVTVAGNGTPGFSGDGGPATEASLAAPRGVAMDSDGNLYIADSGTQRIRMVDHNGIITTVAGNGTQGFSGDGGQATAASLNQPIKVSRDGSGNLYIADFSNHRVRKVIGQPVTFTDVGAGAGVDDSGSGVGAAFGDYDNDGDLDLYVANFGSANQLYRNNGDGTFTDVGTSAGVNDSGNGEGIAWGDYDNDGDLDLYLADFGSANQLYRNNGDGTFTDIGTSAGVNDGGKGVGVAWGDFNNDSFLDLYLVNNGSANRLYQNNGDGTFTEVGAIAGVDDGGTGLGRGVAWGDYNNDGLLDIYLAKDFGANRLYHNNGDGTFTEVGTSAGVDNNSNDGEGVAWGDYDNDGDLDLYVANEGQANRLYRNNGDGTFTDARASAGINDSGLGTGIAWGDYDNDGDLDLYLANQRGANRLYKNNGNGTFTEVSSSSGVNDSGDGAGVAWGDYDNDGDLDLYVANSNGGTNRLYRNNGTPNQWLALNLQGTMSNRDGIGAQVTAVTNTTRQRRDVDGGSGLNSQSSLPVEFGFGTTTTVDSLIIRWPSGIVQVFTDVATNQYLTINESSGIPVQVSLPDTIVTTGALVDTIYIPVSVDSLSSEIFSAAFTVSFDSSIVRALGVETNGTITAGASVLINLSPEQIVVSLSLYSPIMGSGTLIYLRFEVIGQPGDSTALVFESLIFNEGQPAAQTKNGSVVLTAATVAISLPHITPPPSIFADTVYIPVNVGSLDGQGIISASFTVSFDSTVLRSLGVSVEGTIAAAADTVIANTTSPGKIIVGLATPDPLGGSGTLLNLCFEVIGQAGDTTDLVFDFFEFNDGVPAAQTTNGSVEIIGFNISQHITNVLFLVVYAAKSWFLETNFGNNVAVSPVNSAQIQTSLRPLEHSYGH